MRCGVAFLPLVVVAAAPCGASAGAWTLADGDGLLIATAAFSGSTRAFDSKGRLLPVADWRKFELGFHIEYGFTDAVALIVEPVVEGVTVQGPPLGAYRGLESFAAGARARFAEWGDAVFSAQALAKAPGSTSTANPAVWGAEAYEAEARLLAGYSFDLAGMAGFVDGEIAYAARRGGNPGELRVDAALGLRPIENVQLLLQSFNVDTRGGGTFSYPARRWSKLQPSVVYDIAAGWSVQAGAFATIAAVNTRREQGGLLAVWRRF